MDEARITAAEKAIVELRTKQAQIEKDLESGSGYFAKLNKAVIGMGKQIVALTVHVDNLAKTVEDHMEAEEERLDTWTDTLRKGIFWVLATLLATIAALITFIFTNQVGVGHG